jgi:N6-L-threonylcarbamoyladenine synthase
MLGLGIESSCDETSLAIVEDGKRLRSLRIFSQIALHALYNGVVPEIASRAHLEKINYLYEECLEESQVRPKELDYIAVANRPGLLGSLMIGAQFARTLSFVTKKPIVTVDHLQAHLSVVRLEGKEPSYPYLGLLLSGGNTSLFLVHSASEMELLGDTFDDALGEAFDKVASLLGLDYPGGPAIEREAAKYQPREGEKSLFPELLKDQPFEKLDFSYSGIKTSVLYFLRKNPDWKLRIPEIAYHFQSTAFRLVERNLWRAVSQTKFKTVVAAGGVLANNKLRERLLQLAKKKGFQILFPEQKSLCTDNGAMVACLGYELFLQNKIVDLDFRISPNRERFV